MQIEVGESRQQQLDAALRELEQAQVEKDAVASDAAQQAAGLATDAENLQKLLEKTRAESEAKQQSASALRAVVTRSRTSSPGSRPRWRS
jgi:hypothetical protein